MPIVYILINANPGKEKNGFNEIKKIQNVTLPYLVYRFYNLISILNASNIQKLNNSLKKIRNNKNVLSTETIPIIKS